MDALAYYAEPGPLTIIDETDPRAAVALAGLPHDPLALTQLAKGLIVHEFWVQAYGITVPPERADEVETRSAQAIVSGIVELDARPLTEPRDPSHRFVGNCRMFSTLTTALLRHVGIPARARCGFGSYFEPERHVDHWVVEWWSDTEQRWVMTDPQIDDLQRDLLSLPFDQNDMPPGVFLSGGDAWQRCRRHDADPNTFGILDMCGEWFVRGNVIRDLASLNKMELLPWDGWGYMLGGRDDTSGDDVIDTVAAITVGTGLDVDRLRTSYESDPNLRVPRTVTSFRLERECVVLDS